LTKHRNVLVVGVSQGRYDRIAPVLRRREFDVDRFPGVAGALDLLDAVQFAGLIIGVPLADGDPLRFLLAVRRSVKNARVVVALLHPSEHRDEAAALLEAGADHLLGWDATAAEVESFVASALGVPPRDGVRLPVRLKVRLSAAGELLVATTENLSATGMLVECHGSLLVGDRLRCAIDLGGSSIEAIAEVVRIADPAFDGIEGYGLHFREMGEDHAARLEILLENAREAAGTS
jgi:ActR/RegA family two-component response regulator